MGLVVDDLDADVRSSSFSRNQPYATTRGWVSPTRAANSLPTVTDGVNEVDNASELWIAGGTVDEPEEGVARISFGGQSIGSNSGSGSSAALPIRMFNSSGVTLIPGDVVVTDPNVDSGVTTTATASNTRIAGVVQEPIDVASFGKVLFNGFASVVNTTGTVSRGNYALTSATAKLAGATAARVAGSFAVYLTGTDFPDFVTAQRTTEQDTQATTFEVDMPTVPAGRVLFLALWLESGASAVTVSGWTRIGAESGFYYFYKTTEGDDTATPTWTGASVAVATVLLLHESVLIADIVESHDYDTSTSAAAVSSMSTTPARYAIAGVDKAVTPGLGFTRLGGGTAGAAAASGTPALVQSKYGFEGGGSFPGVTFDSTITEGNVMMTVPFTTNATNTYSTDPRQGGSCPIDANMTSFGVTDTNLHTQGGRNAIAVLGKAITSDTYSGPFATPSSCASNETGLLLMEFENINVSDYVVVTDNGPDDGEVNLGTFAGVGANDLIIMAIGWKKDGYGGSPDPTINANGFTQVVDAYSVANGWMWVGYKVGNGDASITHAFDVGDWAAVAVHLTQGATSASGTLAGKYIGHDAAVTSPFTGAGAQNDAIFAINLIADAKASALLYGPDLGGGGAPTTADYLVGTASGDLSAEIVVGTSPGGELGGTWASPTVDAVHAGSAHVTALDGLSDVTITSPTTDDDLRFNGSQWVNDDRKWEAVTGGEDVFVWDGDDLLYDWSS